MEVTDTKLREENFGLRLALKARDTELNKLKESLMSSLSDLWKEQEDIKNMLMNEIEETKKATKQRDSWKKYALILEGKIREMTEKKNAYKQMVKSFSDVIKKILPESPVEDSLVL